MLFDGPPAGDRDCGTDVDRWLDDEVWIACSGGREGNDGGVRAVAAVAACTGLPGGFCRRRGVPRRGVGFERSGADCGVMTGMARGNVGGAGVVGCGGACVDDADTSRVAVPLASRVGSAIRVERADSWF